MSWSYTSAIVLFVQEVVRIFKLLCAYMYQYAPPLLLQLAMTYKLQLTWVSPIYVLSVNAIVNTGYSQAHECEPLSTLQPSPPYNEARVISRLHDSKGMHTKYKGDVHVSQLK